MGISRRDDTRRDTPAEGLPGATLQPMDKKSDVIQDEIPPQKTSIDAGLQVTGRARRDDTRRDTPAKGLPVATLQPMDRGMIQDGIDYLKNLPYAFKKDQ